MSKSSSARLAILGATGPTGLQLLAQARERGAEVNALARDPAKLGKFQGEVTVVQGTVVDPGTVERVVDGCSAVLSALGHVKDSPANLLTTASENMVAAMKKLEVKRLVVLTNTAIEDPSDRPPLTHRIARGALRLMNARLVQDSVPAAKAIADSGLDWTLVRAPILTNGPRTGKYKVGPMVGGMPLRVSRADVADFMLACVMEGRSVRERPVIGQ